MNRTTESLFLRMDPALVRMVRELAKSKHMGISEMAEEALRAYVSDSTSADHRAKLLQATEEALLTRVESRFQRMASNVQGLYAKEALDVALAVELLKQLLALGLRDERQLASLIQGARQEAHRRVSARSNWSGPVPPEVEAQLNKAAQEKAALQQQLAELKQRAEQLEGQADAYRKGQEELRQTLDQARTEARLAERRAEKLHQCYTWAMEQYEAQGMLKRKSLRDFVEEYRRNEQWR